MTLDGWLQIGLFFLVVVALTRPLGAYMFRVFEGERRPLPRLLGPLERVMYRLSGIDPRKEQGWKTYTASMLVFSALGMLVT
jgi:K+-transporting ATPase ATPase A chain